MMDDEVGGMVAVGPCHLCAGVFQYCPLTVPSVLIDPVTGVPPDVGGTDPQRATRRAVCPTCVGRVETARAAQGLPGFPTYPAGGLRPGWE